MRNWLLLLLILSLTACQSEPHVQRWWERSLYEQEWIAIDDRQQVPEAPLASRRELPSYPWEHHLKEGPPKITKEFFRCRGCSLNAVRLLERQGKSERICDCGGTERHSLPLRDGKEFVYPILIDLLNYIQEKTKQRVIITAGHRCPEHHAYVDLSDENRYSKHQIGAEVSFYVEGMEYRPEEVVNWIKRFYQEKPETANKPEYINFERYTKEDAHVLTQPWMNKEIYIKLYTAKEGRNYDNRHPYPYISIQVRYDREKQERVIYSWDKAFNNYYRF